MSEENNNPHEADLLDAMTLSPAEKQEYIAVAGSPKPADEKTASRSGSRHFAAAGGRCRCSG